MPAKVDFSTLTVIDALDLAHLIEVEAQERYTLFARQLGVGLSGGAGDVFYSMADNEKKHGDQLAERRRELFGDTPPRVKRDDIFDVEAPDVGSTRWDMSEFKAYQVALAAEKKAYAFYDRALRTVKLPEVREMFEELRAEEAEHVQMIEEIIKKLPEEAKLDVEDEDDTSTRMGY